MSTNCKTCGAPLQAKRSTKAYCDTRCRVWAHRHPSEAPPWSAAFKRLPAKLRKERLARYDSSGHGRKKSRVEHNTGDNEWYTPLRYMYAAWQVMGGIDLDPASNVRANKLVGATAYYTKEDDGLSRPWHANRVWLNPPYARGLIDKFVAKLVAEFKSGNVKEAIALTNDSTDTGWFHDADEEAAAICFTKGRIPFVSPTGKTPNATQGQAFFYFGPNAARFKEVFGQIGRVR